MNMRDPKRFRINQISVDSVQVNTEETASKYLKDSKVEWDDLVVSITDRDGAEFEVARVHVLRNGCAGESTFMAKLTCAPSWGTETNDDSVKCPLCHFRGHGAGSCERKPL
jgi:hypothetical protein